MNKTKKRVFYSAVFILLLITEILIALFVHDGFIRPYAGDVLVVILMYSFIKIFLPDEHIYLPVVLTVFAVFIEVMQNFDLVSMLGLTGNPLARIVLGTTFDVKDIACYVTGGAAAFAWECLLYKQSK